MAGWILPFITLNSGSDLWRTIHHNPASQADVAALIGYFNQALKFQSTTIVAAPEAPNRTLWRLPFPTYQNRATDNRWKQAVWMAQNFSRPSFPIEVCYDGFYAGESVAGDRV